MKAIDFENDLKLEFQRFAKYWEFRLSPNKSFENILFDYLTVRLRIIVPKKREILLSPQLIKEQEVHPKRKEIKTIIHLARLGSNLNQFQSRRLLQTSFHDHLQNEWNIYHFHLSIQKENNSKFFKQVNSLLFAYLTDDQIIFLGTDTHREGIFGDVKWIEILHDYFPEAIIEYRDKVIKEVHPKVTSIERQSLWNKGYTLGMTNIKGVVYHSPGVGRATSGHGLRVTKTANGLLDWLDKVKEQLVRSEVEICGHFNISPNKAEFKIDLFKQTHELIEKCSKKVILTFPYVFNESGE
jgi:hypothetical protein